jgi:hypothetical protein
MSNMGGVLSCVHPRVFGGVRVAHLFSIVCCVFCFVCYACELCAQCCQCLWIFRSWLPLRVVFFTFIVICVAITDDFHFNLQWKKQSCGVFKNMSNLKSKKNKITKQQRTRTGTETDSESLCFNHGSKLFFVYRTRCEDLSY